MSFIRDPPLLHDSGASSILPHRGEERNAFPCGDCRPGAAPAIGRAGVVSPSFASFGTDLGAICDFHKVEVSPVGPRESAPRSSLHICKPGGIPRGRLSLPVTRKCRAVPILGI